MYECTEPVGEEVSCLLFGVDLSLTTDPGGTPLEDSGISCTNS